MKFTLYAKQSGGKILPTRISGRSVSTESSRKIHKDNKLGTWFVRDLYRAGSLTATARELARYKLDEVGVHQVRWETEGTLMGGDYNYFHGKEMKINLEWVFCALYICICSKENNFVSDRFSYIVLSGRWLYIIVVNVHARSEEKREDLKDNFYDELEEVFHHFPKYHMKILPGHFNG